MKKFKLIILSLLISTSASAQQPSLPELDLPDLSLDENAKDTKALKVPDVTVSNETKPTIPALPSALPPTGANNEQNKVLNKAIDEVFKETDKKAEPLVENKSELASPAAAEPAKIPEVLNNPDVKVIEVSPEQPLIEKTPVETKAIEEQMNADNPEVPAVIQPEETTATDIKEPAEEVKKDIVSETKKVEEVAKKDVAKPAKPIVKKSKPAKKVVFPTQTPKSLRQNYSNPISNIEGETFIQPSLSPASQPNFEKNIDEKINYKGLPENTRPIMLNNIWKKKLKTDETLLAKSDAVDNSLKPKSQRYNSIIPDEVEKNLYSKTSDFSGAKKKSNPDLDIFAALPKKKEKLEVKSDIKLEESKFTSPFPEDEIKPSSEPPSLAETEVKETEKELGVNQDNAPVVDFSDNQIENIDELATNEQEIPQGFYEKELGLKVEVKDRPVRAVGSMKNAYEALQVGQYESAIEYYKEALQVNPNNGKARFGLATSYHKSKLYDNAKEEYLKIINKNPDFWPAVNNYIMLVSEENPASSISKLEELRQKNPDFAAIPAQLGSLYYNNGKLDKAIKCYIDALKIESGNIDYKYNLAVILEKAGNYRDAAEVYRSLLEDSAEGKKLPENPIVIKDRYDMLTSKARG